MGKRIAYYISLALPIASALALALSIGYVAPTIAQNDGPKISVSTRSVVANQRISLSASGYTPNAEIGRVAEGETQVSGITIAGEAVPWDRINDGNAVNINSDGEWSTTVDLPLTALTTTEGFKLIEATDSGGLSDVDSLNIGKRGFFIDPHAGRVGTMAPIFGEGFPAKNDNGSSFTMAVSYDTGSGNGTTITVTPFANGELRAQVQIPTTATIPSTNTVKISFQDDDGVVVEETATHEVLPPAIYISPTSGIPGTAVFITGEGFKANVPIRSVTIGGLNVTPAPNIPTDSDGMLSFDIDVPGLDPAIQTIEVTAGSLTASSGFTVRAEPTPAPSPTATPTPSPTPVSTPLPTQTATPSDLDGTIRLVPNSGPPGTLVTVYGEGFRAMSPLRGVIVGGVNATPNPLPYTDKDGRLTIGVIIPSLNPGTHNFFVKSGWLNVAYSQFRVMGPPEPTPTPSPTAAPTPTPPPQLPGRGEPPHIFMGTARLDGFSVSEGTPINAYDGRRLIGATEAGAGGRFNIHTHRTGNAITFEVADSPASETWSAWDSGRITRNFHLTASSTIQREDTPARLFQANPALVRVFYFDNNSKQWYLYDPTIDEFSDLHRFIEGQTYLFLVSRHTRAIMNEAERDLTCLAGNCWNQIVW